MEKCRFCGKSPIIECWNSGGMMYMVKCNNPNCCVPVEGYPTGRKFEEVAKEWNERNKSIQGGKSALFC
jgi:hypothetical protein